MNTKIFSVALIVVFLGIVFFMMQDKSVPVVATQAVSLKDGDIYDLTAGYVTKEIGGRSQKMLAYNGSIPGPTIRVAQGSEVTINFKNDTDLPALLHSHGVRMDSAFDGSQTVQKEMQPGQSFSYKLKFPDAGVYWYHPHVKEVYGQGLGLYGAFIVEPKDRDYYPPVDRKEVLFLSDLPMENGAIALDKDTASHSLMGHYGDVMLVNGQENYVLTAKKGEVLRLFIINAANVRPFNLAIKGVRLKLVGGDSGAYERATWQDSVLLAPSERVIVDVMFTEPTTIVNDTPAGMTALGSVSIDGEVQSAYISQFNQLQTNAATIASIDPFRPYFAKVPDKTLALTVDMSMGNMGGMDHSTHGMSGMGSMMGGVPQDGIEWEDTSGMMNAMSSVAMVKWHIVDQVTGKKDMDIDWNFKKGEPVKIRIFNDPKSAHPMQHPIHFHGQRFLVVARLPAGQAGDGVPQTNLPAGQAGLVWKDTTLVKAGETVDIILDPSNPGTWMAHCHISEHLEAGMMMQFTVK